MGTEEKLESSYVNYGLEIISCHENELNIIDEVIYFRPC